MITSGEDDDDFIRTISDDDKIVQSSADSEDLELGGLTKKNQNSRKRKRDKDQLEIFPDAADGSYDKNKTIKKRKNHSGALAKDNGHVEEEEGDTWTAHGEDDGALDSDFEFQIGDIDNWVTEDLDGWDPKAKTAAIKVMALGDRKGVDIDAIIARRGKRDTVAMNGVTDPTKSEERSQYESGLDETTGSEAEGPGIEEDEDENEDQTLDEDAFGMGVANNEEEEGNESLAEDQILESSSDEDSIAEPVPHPDDLDSHVSSADEIDAPEEQARRKAFFASEETETTSKSKNKNTTSGSFQSMSLSRPILRGLAAMGFSEPTPIQVKTIPVALLGKDVVGGAVTGSGKTAAFVIPILERLLYRPKRIPTSRVAILMPTRELAVQCYNVAKKLASFTDVTFCQLVGGFSLREQESVLRQRPDVIIATPGRFIDHMRNSASFTVDTLEILVLDEADRMLEDGFADELNEILTTIPRSRQTMLFSATMTDRVDKLIRVGLNRPVRLMVDARKQTVGTLIQEFVRLRPGREDKRLGYLLYLCQNIYTDHTIIFFRQKKVAHRVRIIFGLFGIKAAELHGSMSQEQRISALASFRTSQTTHLLATDLASRGLDIPTVTTVINYEAPQTHEIYLHRVGRTARAGRTGRACTIAAEPDRKIVKQTVKAGKAQGAKIVSRVIEPTLADEWAAKCAALDAEVDSILEEEKEEKALAGAEMQVRKGENIMTHEDEIKSRPKRTWFESEKDKLVAKKKGMVELNGAVGLGKKGVGGKLSHKDKKRLDDGRERKEGRLWKKGRGEGVGVVGKGKGKDNRGRSGSGGGRKGKGGKEGGGKAKKVKGGGVRR